MNRHLSDEQISAWTAGERSPFVERHLAECAACRAQIEELTETLALFRAAVRDAGDRQPQPALRWHPHRPAMRWMLAAATVILMVAGSATYWTSVSRKRAAETARADTLLLEQIDRAIAQPVPGPMEPLVPLVSWAGNAAADQTQ